MAVGLIKANLKDFIVDYGYFLAKRVGPRRQAVRIFSVGLACDVYFSNVHYDAKFSVSLDVAAKGIIPFIIVMEPGVLEVRLKAYSMDGALSVFEAFDKIISFFGFAKHPGGRNLNVVIVVEEQSLRIGGIGPLKGFAYKVINFCVGTGSDFVCAAVCYHLVNHVPDVKLSLVSQDCCLDVVPHKGLDCFLGRSL